MNRTLADAAVLRNGELHGRSSLIVVRRRLRAPGLAPDPEEAFQLYFFSSWVTYGLILVSDVGRAFPLSLESG